MIRAPVDKRFVLCGKEVFSQIRSFYRSNTVVDWEAQWLRVTWQKMGALKTVD